MLVLVQAVAQAQAERQPEQARPRVQTRELKEGFTYKGECAEDGEPHGQVRVAALRGTLPPTGTG